MAVVLADFRTGGVFSEFSGINDAKVNQAIAAAQARHRKLLAGLQPSPDAQLLADRLIGLEAAHRLELEQLDRGFELVARSIAAQKGQYTPPGTFVIYPEDTDRYYAQTRYGQELLSDFFNAPGSTIV